MTQLEPPKLGTPRDAKISYCLHETGSLLVGDFFTAGYFNACLLIVENAGAVHKNMLRLTGAASNASAEQIETLLAQADDNIRWAKEMREEGYHQTNAHAFLSQWAALEAGNENVIAAVIEKIRSAADAVAGRFSKGRYDISIWPWPEDTCLEIAQKLDQKAKNKTPDGGWDATARLSTLFRWLGVSFDIEKQAAIKFNEASMVRNIIVHRYGRPSASDIARDPLLSEWQGKSIPMTQDRLHEYHRAMIAVHLAICQGIWANGWK